MDLNSQRPYGERFLVHCSMLLFKSPFEGFAMEELSESKYESGILIKLERPSNWSPFLILGLVNNFFSENVTGAQPMRYSEAATKAGLM